MTAEPRADLADVLGAVVRTLDSGQGVDATLQSIVAAAIGTIPGADSAAVTLVKHRKSVQSVAPSDELARCADLLQEEVGEGPCLDAVRDHHVVTVPDLRTEQRWPRYAARAAELGVGSQLAFQLFADEGHLGALNLYSRTARAFSTESEHIGHLFAAHAAVALSGAQRQVEFADGLASRDLIGQAKGVLIERYGITGDAAFLALTRTSQDTNTKLRDIAGAIVREAEAPRADTAPVERPTPRPLAACTARHADPPGRAG